MTGGVTTFRKLCPSSILSLELTFNSGQTFHWRRHSSLPSTWVTYLHPHFPVALYQSKSHVYYCVPLPLEQEQQQGYGVDHVEKVLHTYFRLGVDLDTLLGDWSKGDDTPLVPKCLDAKGLRLLDQDPIVTIFEYICSSNNNVKRITKMFQSLLEAYGNPVQLTLPDLPCEDDTHHRGKDRVEDSTRLEHDAGKLKHGRQNCSKRTVEVYSFPEISRLAESDVAVKLRELGFGYRAEFVRKTARRLHQLGVTTSHELLARVWDPTVSTSHEDGDEDEGRAHQYSQAIDFLTTLPGVGRKVADCVALSSLSQPSAIPIDVHVYRISTRDLGFRPKTKTLTKGTYEALQALWRDRYGEWCGWAQLILFERELSKDRKRAASSQEESAETLETPTRYPNKKRRGSLGEQTGYQQISSIGENSRG